MLGLPAFGSEGVEWSGIEALEEGLCLDVLLVCGTRCGSAAGG